MTRFASLTLILLLTATLAATGCPKKKKDNAKPAPKVETPLDKAKSQLKELGIDASTLTQNGGDWSLSVETSGATKYDAQLVASWGQIFGTLAWFADETVTIINTMDGKPVMRIRARVRDIMDMQRGVITEKDFMGRWEYEPVK